VLNQREEAFHRLLFLVNNNRRSALLTADAVINITLGAPLALFPRSVISFLGLPVPETPFYASILGAVLVGVGLALVVQRFCGSQRIAGLGLAGAITINACGGIVLMIWLIGGGLALPVRGHVVLWCIAVIVLGIGTIELIVLARQRRR
jgi:hypothetical protein